MSDVLYNELLVKPYVEYSIWRDKLPLEAQEVCYIRLPIFNEEATFIPLS